MRKPLAIISYFALMFLFVSVSSAQESMRLTVTQWVRPSEAGAFTARVVVPLVDGGLMTVTDAKVVLLGRNGTTHQGRTDEAGEVTLTGVNPGIYAMLARGHEAIACYAMHVLDHEHIGADVYPEIVEIAAANLDHATFESMIYPYLAPEYNRETLSIDEVQFEELTDQVRGNEAYRVTQFGNGIRGRICRGSAEGGALVHAESMNVFLLKDGFQKRRDVTDEEGKFEFQDVDPGVYSLITVGPHGMGVVGFELKGRTTALLGSREQKRTAEGHRLVTLIQAPGEFDFDIQVIPVEPDELTIIEETTMQEEEVIMGDPIFGDTIPMEDFGIPISGGGFVPGSGGGPGGGGGFGGGGSGGGGGGGFGGIAALAGIGAVIAASSSGSGSSTPPPVSPVTPPTQ